MERIKGSVRWFDETKGFGFITSEEFTTDVFIHHSNIQAEGFRTLNEGDKVEFETEKTQKGIQAINLTVTEKAPRKQVVQKGAE